MTPSASPQHDDAGMIASAFTSARLSSRPLAGYPGPIPGSLDDAYRVQEQAISLWPDRVAGWKLGRIAPPMDARFGAGRIAGPIFSRMIWNAGPDPTPFEVIDGGFAAVEAEYVLELGETAPDRDGWTVADAAALVGRVMVGVEIAGSPFAGINDNGPTVTASDFGNNAGLILGGEVADWRERLDALSCEMQIDGAVVGRGGASLIPGGPLDSLAFLLNALHRRGRRLEAGQLVSTGAATGVHQIRIGQAAVADFGPDGSIACIARPAKGAAS